MGPSNSRSFFIVLACFFFWACGSSSLEGEPDDGEIDTTGEDLAQDDLSDGQEEPDGEIDIPSEDLVQEDPIDSREDDPPIEPEPEPCNGTDTLNLRYVDLDGNPRPDLAVALMCLDNQVEAWTDGDGRVSFENLDLASYPVAVTCADEGFAYTLTDIGGSRTVPDPLQIPLQPLPWLGSPETMNMEGDIVRTQPGSEVLVSTSTMDEDYLEERYLLYFAPVGTDLPMSVFEYTVEGPFITPVGYAFLRYDSPPERVDGPAAAPGPAEFLRASVTVDYDIRDGSPFHDLEWVDIVRSNWGIWMRGFDSSEKSWCAGILSSWSSEASFGTIEAAWTEEALAEAVRVEASVVLSISGVPGPLEYYVFQALLPENPPDWTSVTLHDPPEPLDPDFTGPLSFDQELPMQVPGRVNLVRYVVWPALDAEPAFWTIETPSERSSILFDSLPWPSSVSQIEFLGTSDVVPPKILLMGRVYDADPFDHYALWSDPAWSGIHFVSMASAAQLVLEPPED